VNGSYRAPETPGAPTEIRPESLAEYSFPSGPAWRDSMIPKTLQSVQTVKPS